MIPRDSVTTHRLVLEPIHHVHDEDLQDAVTCSLRELEPWMPWAPGHTIDTQRGFTDRALEGWEQGTEYAFAIVLDGVPVGTVGLRLVEPRAYEIGYWIRSDCAGHGYTTEAARAALEFAFENLAARRVVLNAGAENTRSRRIAEKLGFTRTGDVPGGMEGGHGRVFQAFRHELERASPSSGPANVPS